MAFWRSLGGMVRVVLTSADIPGALSAMDKQGIGVESAKAEEEMVLSFTIDRRDLQALQRLCESRGESLKVERKSGIFFPLRGLLRRPVLVLGMLGLLILSLWVPGRVFFVFVEGNEAVPSNLILEQASLCGIDFGASRREIRSEKVKNALLSQIPQLQWVGVNTQGCVAVISVRERSDTEKEENIPDVSSIVAARDGIIREMTVLHGNPLCTQGQAVKAGQVLISGYTDCGICIQAGRAEGEIYGETSRNFTALFPTEYAVRGDQTSETKKYSLIIGKKRINFSNSSGISGGECVKIYSEQYLTLPGGFRLPIAIAVEQCVTYETEVQTHADPESILLPFITDYLQSQMIAGQIRSSAQTATRLDGFYRIDGIYGCYEMIGITRPEESILDYENHRTDS